MTSHYTVHFVVLNLGVELPTYQALPLRPQHCSVFLLVSVHREASTTANLGLPHRADESAKQVRLVDLAFTVTRQAVLLVACRSFRAALRAETTLVHSSGHDTRHVLE